MSESGWEIREQRFSERSPENKIIDFCNLVAGFSKGPIAGKRLLIGTHFDSLRTQIFSDRSASASAASTAILIELARILALNPVLASQVELVFFDGANPFREVTSIDGFFGSRFFAEMLDVNREIDRISAAVILENVGSGNFSLNVTRGSDPVLVSKFRTAASSLDLNLKSAGRWIVTNQDPFAERGVPAITLFDADSPILNTADDTAEHLSADSLAKTGTLIVYFISSDLAFSNQ
ncbi:MAG: M28 family peptidase [Verrucomicrobia bacterium]|nr:M28 family peptidase [Verrucomicrobiota bacterium]MBV9673662.1 M28 family peptidase [Verrucomicrobiota bacterium]